METNPIKAIILAAGMGSRLGKYTASLPKGMLPFLERSLIEWQILTYRKLGISNIIIITGYCHEKISFSGVKNIHNSKFNSTNMVESLMLAKDFFDTDLIISYADLIFEEKVLQQLIEFSDEVGVVVDLNWKSYWKDRYGRMDLDIESLNLDQAGQITNLGVPDVLENSVDGRYVGLIKLSHGILEKFIEVYEKERESYKSGAWRNSKSFIQGQMTDLLQAFIDSGQNIKAIKITGGWLEFDTVQDYQKYNRWIKEKSLSNYIKLPDLSAKI